MGVSIVSIETVSLFKNYADVVAIPIDDEFCHMDVYFAWKMQPDYSDAFNAFRTYIRSYRPEELEEYLA